MNGPHAAVNVAELSERFDDGVSALERIADSLAVIEHQGQATTRHLERIARALDAQAYNVSAGGDP